MKVLYITDQMYLHGGGERVLTNKANYFIDNGIAEVYIVTSEQKGNAPCYPIKSEVIFEDLAINYNRAISYFYPYNFIKIPKHFFRLNRIINKIKPDVIVTLSAQFDYYFLPFIHKKIPKIKEFHSSRHYASLSRKRNRSVLRRLMYRFNDYIESKYDRLAILTNDEQQYFKSQNTVVIPNSYTNYPKNKSDLTSKIAVSAGRIAPVKQFDKLIVAWWHIAQTHPDWRLEIYGKGEEQDVKLLQKMIDDFNIGNQVKLCGETNDLESKMLNSSLYVMSSKTECFPMVLLEAMTCGLPIVSFDCPHGPGNIITDDGVLVEMDNEKKLAEAVVSIINNTKDHKEKGNRSRENVKRYSLEKICNQWSELFVRLMNS
ncbi:glycosyltransferase involved in cell wall biosynthesis [Aquimarina sp. MAR_2010_214]|uniref:glycosyltransferase family 4 protein n=1 Tax=Aquimarina sp. MAR_2010_214 TaxID=1250026 RepID=UPI000C709008|nr:glycosyltransferase family 4 protein [Aquimarina sp. MAR_2010_214]PKV50980.1 glycosyltransferase involved in cell wall biosynthesis [Aquimarina sp. MAR_2010_214]